MFTGLVEETGTVLSADDLDGLRRLEVGCSTVLEGTVVGDSVSVDGCCLTVTALSDHGFATELMAGTLATTALGSLAAGTRVNLERAMRADARLGGHLVQGHVDTVGEVLGVDEAPGQHLLRLRVPGSLARYVVERGSLTVQGVSLTVAGVDGAGTVSVGLIPHTREVTTLGSHAAGDAVNLEADVIAKYVERLLAAGIPSPYVASGGPEPAGPGATSRAQEDA